MCGIGELGVAIHFHKVNDSLLALCNMLCICCQNLLIKRVIM